MNQHGDLDQYDLRLIWYISDGRFETVSYSALSTITNVTITTVGGGGSIPTIGNSTTAILPITTSTIANLGIPLTGSAAMGFTIGFLKG